MQYLVPFSGMQDWLQQNATTEHGMLDLRYDDLQDLIRHVLAAVPVDQDWYCQTYEGVGRSVARGDFRCAAHHFVLHGYFEDRAPWAAGSTQLVSPPPFVELMATLTVRPRDGTLYVDMTYDDLHTLLSRVVAAVPVDEEWYCARYQDVQPAIASGRVASPTAHFVTSGFFESRWPFAMPVDSQWYCLRYHDVRVDMGRGFGDTVDEHFMARGYGQVRFPRDGWITLLWDRAWSPEMEPVKE